MEHRNELMYEYYKHVTYTVFKKKLFPVLVITYIESHGYWILPVVC